MSTSLVDLDAERTARRLARFEQLCQETIAAIEALIVALDAYSQRRAEAQKRADENVIHISRV